MVQAIKSIEELLEEIQNRGLFLVNLFQLSGEETLGIWQANIGDREQNWAFAKAETAADALAQALANAVGPGHKIKKQENKWKREESRRPAEVAGVNMEDLGL